MSRSATDDAIRDAIDRDLRDQERLDHIKQLITDLLDGLIVDLYPLEHPEARWHPDDLVEILGEQLTSIGWERQRVSRGLVSVVPSDYTTSRSAA